MNSAGQERAACRQGGVDQEYGRKQNASQGSPFGKAHSADLSAYVIAATFPPPSEPRNMKFVLPSRATGFIACFADLLFRASWPRARYGPAFGKQLKLMEVSSFRPNPSVGREGYWNAVFSGNFATGPLYDHHSTRAGQSSFHIWKFRKPRKSASLVCFGFRVSRGPLRNQVPCNVGNRLSSTPQVTLPPPPNPV